MYPLQSTLPENDPGPSFERMTYLLRHHLPSLLSLPAPERATRADALEMASRMHSMALLCGRESAFLMSYMNLKPALIHAIASFLDTFSDTLESIFSVVVGLVESPTFNSECLPFENAQTAPLSHAAPKNRIRSPQQPEERKAGVWGVAVGDLGDDEEIREREKKVSEDVRNRVDLLIEKIEEGDIEDLEKERDPMVILSVNNKLYDDLLVNSRDNIKQCQDSIVKIESLGDMNADSNNVIKHAIALANREIRSIDFKKGHETLIQESQTKREIGMAEEELKQFMESRIRKIAQKIFEAMHPIPIEKIDESQQTEKFSEKSVINRRESSRVENSSTIMIMKAEISELKKKNKALMQSNSQAEEIISLGLLTREELENQIAKLKVEMEWMTREHSSKLRKLENSSKLRIENSITLKQEDSIRTAQLYDAPHTKKSLTKMKSMELKLENLEKVAKVHKLKVEKLQQQKTKLIEKSKKIIHQLVERSSGNNKEIGDDLNHFMKDLLAEDVRESTVSDIDSKNKNSISNVYHVGKKRSTKKRISIIGQNEGTHFYNDDSKISENDNDISKTSRVPNFTKPNPTVRGRVSEIIKLSDGVYMKRGIKDNVDQQIGYTSLLEQDKLESLVATSQMLNRESAEIETPNRMSVFKAHKSSESGNIQKSQSNKESEKNVILVMSKDKLLTTAPNISPKKSTDHIYEDVKVYTQEVDDESFKLSQDKCLDAVDFSCQTPIERIDKNIQTNLLELIATNTTNENQNIEASKARIKKLGNSQFRSKSKLKGRMPRLSPVSKRESPSNPRISLNRDKPSLRQRKSKIVDVIDFESQEIITDAKTMNYSADLSSFALSKSDRNYSLIASSEYKHISTDGIVDRIAPKKPRYPKFESNQLLDYMVRKSRRLEKINKAPKRDSSDIGVSNRLSSFVRKEKAPKIMVSVSRDKSLSIANEYPKGKADSLSSTLHYISRLGTIRSKDYQVSLMIAKSEKAFLDINNTKMIPWEWNILNPEFNTSKLKIKGLFYLSNESREMVGFKSKALQDLQELTALEVFTSRISAFKKDHRLCGEDCPHLIKFYSGLGIINN